MRRLSFAVYSHELTYERNILSRHFIVLKDENGNIVLWTDFHKYARSGLKKRVLKLTTTNRERCLNVVQFLNYVFFGKYHITRLTDIKAVMVKDFFTDYGLCRLPGDDENTHRNEATVDICIAYIFDFLDLVIRDNPSCRMKVSDLYRKEMVLSKNKKTMVEKKIPVFEVRCKPGKKVIFRDITDGAFEIILSEIAANHTNILMLAALEAFAGIRPSEACNVRRVDSALGAGMSFKFTNGEISDIYIDLTEELNLRSDLIRVGAIKKERTQKVYHAFLDAFIQCYKRYMDFIEGKPYETEFGALTNNSKGLAMTYDSYAKEFKDAVKAAIPAMLASDNPQTVHYGHLMQENSVSPHILRHWFSVKLTLYGENEAGLMYWRGDKSPESALTYLRNKSELEKQFERVNNEAFNYAYWYSDKLFAGDTID